MKRRLVGAFLALVAAGILFAVAASTRSNDANGLLQTVETAQVTAAAFYIALPVEGAVEAASAVPVVCKVPDTQIISVVPDGTRVEVGDVIMTVNSDEVQKKVDRLRSQVAEAEENVRKTRAGGEKRVQNARTAFAKAQEGSHLAKLKAKAAVEKAEAEVAFLEKELVVVEGELEKCKRLREEGLVPITDVEQAEDALRDKTFGLEDARRSLTQARADAETSLDLKKMDLRTAELEVQQAEAAFVTSVISAERQLAARQINLDEAEEQLVGVRIRAPVSGLVLIETTWEGGSGRRARRTGDQVRENMRVGSVIDLSEMWVRCDIGEADIDSVNADMPAFVSVPAIGATELRGKVLAVDSLGGISNPWEGGVPGKSVFAAIIEVTTPEPRLRPGMGASVEIVLDYVTEGLAVPLEALFSKGGDTVIYRAEDSGYRELPAKVLKRNNALAAIEADIEEGDGVACTRPAASLLLAAERGERK